MFSLHLVSIWFAVSGDFGIGYWEYSNMGPATVELRRERDICGLYSNIQKQNGDLLTRLNICEKDFVHTKAFLNFQNYKGRVKKCHHAITPSPLLLPLQNRGEECDNGL